MAKLLQAGTATLAVVLGAAPLRAAVRSCLTETSGRIVEHKTELEAKKQTLADWHAKAREAGPGYTRWELAFDRRIDCTRTPSGFSCQAIAAPCVIKQVPPADGVLLKPSPDRQSKTK